MEGFPLQQNLITFKVVDEANDSIEPDLGIQARRRFGRFFQIGARGSKIAITTGLRKGGSFLCALRQ